MDSTEIPQMATCENSNNLERRGSKTVTFKSCLESHPESPDDKEGEPPFPNSTSHLNHTLVNTFNEKTALSNKVALEIDGSLSSENDDCTSLSNDTTIELCPNNHDSDESTKYNHIQDFLPPTLNKRRMSQLPKRLPVNLEFLELNYCVETGRKKYKSILKGVSGVFKSGQLNAIMGPSGAGKSTLMNILAGYRTNGVSGEILVNGNPRCLKSFRKLSCYIMQEDYLLPFLTVQESMDVASSLKLGNHVSKEVRAKLVREILDTLSLTPCKNTKVSDISGGEKKRLSIAQELVNNPPVMFFDEPTSGLDSQNSYQCISLLQNLASEGRTIICSIHQPSSRLFQQFDMLYALADGQCIYRGSINSLVPFLSSLTLECPAYHNPADFLVEVSSGEYGDFIPQLAAAVKCVFLSKGKNGQPGRKALELDLVPTATNTDGIDTKNIGNHNTNSHCIYSPKEDNIKLQLTPEQQTFLPNVEDDSPPDYAASYWTQFTVLFKRTFLSIIRDMMLTKLRFAAHIVVGIFIGILYYNIGNEGSKVLNNVGCLFFSVMFLLFTAMMPTILTFPLEMNVFLREHLNHWYSLKTYYLAKIMADVPFQIIFPMTYVIIVYFMTNQPLEMERFATFSTLCIMTSLVAQSIGLAIGAALNVQQAVFFGPAVAIPALLFSGFFVTFSTIPIYLRWLTYVSYIRYGYEGSLLAIYGNSRKPLDCSEAFCMFKFPEKILEQLDVKNSDLWFDMLLLLVYFLVMRALGYFILRWKLKKEL